VDAIADHNLRLIVENGFGRQFVIADRNGESRAAADGQAERRVDPFSGGAARTLGDQDALLDLLIRSGLRQSAPGAVGEMHGLAGHRPFRGGCLGAAGASGRAKKRTKKRTKNRTKKRADHQGAKPAVCRRHRLPRNSCHLCEL
jgi:hypothetical protein